MSSMPDFPKPPPVPRPDPLIYQAIGTRGVVRLIKEFYAEIARSPIAHLFPQEPDALMASAENSALFWVNVLGGPPLYAEKHGPPMIRQRHDRFAISPQSREHWLACWDAVLPRAPELVGFPQACIPGFRAWINTFSAFIVNTVPE